MSTLLIDTNGGSVFSDSTDLVDSSTELGRALKDNNLGKVHFTNVDNKPVLVPTRSVIDVVNDFSWYAGPKATSAALDKIPCVFLTEREQLLSSLISGALYYLNAAAGAAGGFLESDFIKSIKGKLWQGRDAAAGGSGGGVQDLINDLQSIGGGTASDIALLNQHNLKSLAGIYFTKETGFNYRLPMYGSPSTVTGEWSDASGSADNILKTVVEKGQQIVDNISNIVNFAQPGVYIEKPKYFQGVQGREESVTFPLVNTVRRGTHSPVQQNYELLWLLAFQNKAYKTSFARTPPPKIYSVNVPGQFSMPYAFISGMDVKFMGTTRKTTVFVPSGNGEGVIGSKPITTPIPEAYQVTLKFTSLIGDYGNTMLSNAFTPYIDGQKVIIGNVGSK